MMTCGMYDYSGEFAFAAGIPAKSGVSGSLIIVIPNLCGICCYSPPLDPIGNSVKGVAFAQRLVEKFPFHNFDYGDCGKPDPRKHPDHKEMADLVDLLFGAQVGDQAKIMEYCSKDFDFGNADYDDRTALHILCSDGHLDALRLIGDHYKKMGKRHELVKLLCEKKDRWGHTPKDEVKGENSQKVLRYINQMQKIEMENLKQGYVKH